MHVDSDELIIICDDEVGGKTTELHVENAVIGLFVRTVGDHLNALGKRRGPFVVDAHDPGPRGLRDETVESAVQSRNGTGAVIEGSVELQVVWLDVGHNHAVCTEFHKGAVTFVGLHHECITIIPVRTTRLPDDLPADDPRWTQPARLEHVGKKRRCRGFPMCTSDGERSLDCSNGTEDLRSS